MARDIWATRTIPIPASGGTALKLSSVIHQIADGWTGLVLQNAAAVSAGDTTFTTTRS